MRTCNAGRRSSDRDRDRSVGAAKRLRFRVRDPNFIAARLTRMRYFNHGLLAQSHSHFVLAEPGQLRVVALEFGQFVLGITCQTCT